MAMPAGIIIRRSSTAVILLITVGLVGKVFTRQIDSAEAEAMKPCKTPSQQYFDAVAPDDREQFVKYHLDKALEEVIPNHVSVTPADFRFIAFKEPVEPEDFATNLLHHFQSTYDATENDVFNFVMYNLICFPTGICFDPDDVGSICCPF